MFGFVALGSVIACVLPHHAACPSSLKAVEYGHNQDQVSQFDHSQQGLPPELEGVCDSSDGC